MPDPTERYDSRHRPEWEFDVETNVYRGYCNTEGCTWHREYAGKGAIIRAVYVHRRYGKDND